MLDKDERAFFELGLDFALLQDTDIEDVKVRARQLETLQHRDYRKIIPVVTIYRLREYCKINSIKHVNLQKVVMDESAENEGQIDGRILYK